jgi:hypothetical protein
MKFCPAAIAFVCAFALAAVPAFGNPSSRAIRPAFLPVPYSVNEHEDRSTFKPAPSNVALHEYFSFPGWVTAADFEGL